MPTTPPLPPLPEPHFRSPDAYTAAQMHAYVEADRRSRAPEGWVCVPREPTLEMEVSGEHEFFAYPGRSRSDWAAICGAAYRAMIAAAPVATPTEPAARAQGAGEAMRILGEEIGAYGLLCATKGELAPYRSLVDAMNAVASLITAPTIPQPAETAGKAEGHPDTALGFILEALEANHKWHQDYDDHGGYPDSELEARNVQAIAVAHAGISHPPIAAPAGDDTRRLDWLDTQRVAYGFADVHEGNGWEISGAYGSIRQAIDHESAAEGKAARASGGVA